jgi:D-alanyl-D-alanine carboxypeptidase
VGRQPRALILQLVDQGRLSLDDTIDRWFPNVKDASQITIRELGNMSSGITSYSLDDTAMRTMIFAPLGMKHTSYPATNKLPSPFWSGYTDQGAAAGQIRNATDWSPTAAGAAGQAISTLGDLRIWARALGTGALLKPATQRERLIPNPASRAGSRAYLFAVGIDNGWLSHSGEIPGYNTQIAYLPKDKITIVVLANADIANTDGPNPAPSIFNALAGVIAPNNRPGQVTNG